MNKLFDDTPYIDRTVVTDCDKNKWKKAFQEYCDSEKIRKESDLTGLNACGYWYACDYCDGSDGNYSCAKALIEYLEGKGVEIDYKNISREYLDELLRWEK